MESNFQQSLSTIILLIIAVFYLTPALAESDTTTTAKETKPDSHLAPSKGFGDNIEWVTLDYAKEHAKDKPVMIIIHKSWCGACRRLKPLVSRILITE